MMSTIFFLFLAYVFYLLIFKVAFPIWRTTRAVRRAFRDAQDLHGTGPVPGNGRQKASVKKEAAPKKGDYIDFEEL